MKQARTFNTPLGKLLAIADDKALLSLQFSEEEDKEGKSPILLQIEEEIHAYFTDRCPTFTTPLHFPGTPFQRQVWGQLLEIPFGKTVSYKELACKIERILAVRAVANANGANPYVIIVPCHRVIYSSGGLGGYSAGLWRKKWLLEHEGLYTT